MPEQTLSISTASQGDAWYGIAARVFKDDATGRLVIPGLVNAHLHVTDTPCTKGFLEEIGASRAGMAQNFAALYRILPAVRAATDPDAQVAAAACAFAELARTGSTTVVELGYDYEIGGSGDIAATERVAETAGASGLRCYSGPRYHRDRHSALRGVGRSLPLPLSAPGPLENGAEVAVERGVHLAALLAGGEHDALDQPPDGFGRLVAVARVGERLGEPFHLAPVDDGDVGVDVRDVGRDGGEALGDLVLAGFQLAEPVGHAPHIAALLDGVEHRRDTSRPM